MRLTRADMNAMTTICIDRGAALGLPLIYHCLTSWWIACTMMLNPTFRMHGHVTNNVTTGFTGMSLRGTWLQLLFVVVDGTTAWRTQKQEMEPPEADSPRAALPMQVSWVRQNILLSNQCEKTREKCSPVLSFETNVFPAACCTRKPCFRWCYDRRTKRLYSRLCYVN